MGIQKIMEVVRLCNSLVQEYKPWQLIKSPNSLTDLNRMMFVVNETLRITGILLQAIVPNLANDLLDRLGVDADRRLFKDAKVRRNGPGYQLNELKSSVLFKKSTPLINNKTR